MQAIDCIKSRVSNNQLIEPAPSSEQIKILLECAVRAPDYGLLRPWQFIVVQGEERQLLGRLMADATLSLDPTIGQEKLARIESLPLRAPLIIIVNAIIQQDLPKVSPEEQLMSAAAATQNILLACHALGYAAIWRTGEFAKNESLKAMFKLKAHDRIVGFLYIGTPSESKSITEANYQHFSKKLSEIYSY